MSVSRVVVNAFDGRGVAFVRSGFEDIVVEIFEILSHCRGEEDLELVHQKLNEFFEVGFGVALPSFFMLLSQAHYECVCGRRFSFSVAVEDLSVDCLTDFQDLWEHIEKGEAEVKVLPDDVCIHTPTATYCLSTTNLLEYDTLRNIIIAKTCMLTLSILT